MKYRGEHKIYYEIGVKEDWTRFQYKRFLFCLFFLRKRPPEGEMMKFWRDYIGINYESSGWHYPQS